MGNVWNIMTTPIVSAIDPSEIKITQKSHLAFDLERLFSVFFERLSGDDDEDF
jgi:hypothetical protein